MPATKYDLIISLAAIVVIVILAGVNQWLHRIASTSAARPLIRPKTS